MLMNTPKLLNNKKDDYLFNLLDIDNSNKTITL